MVTKKCFRCGRSLPLSRFYKHPQMADGHLNKCKDCTKSDARKTRRARIEYYREYDLNRSSLPHRVRARLRYHKEYVSTYPDRKVAHSAVSNAIRDGRLTRKACEICGAESVHAHHDDYSRPLDVRWLCPVCHARVHLDMREVVAK